MFVALAPTALSKKWAPTLAALNPPTSLYPPQTRHHVPSKILIQPQHHHNIEFFIPIQILLARSASLLYFKVCPHLVIPSCDLFHTRPRHRTEPTSTICKSRLGCLILDMAALAAQSNSKSSKKKAARAIERTESPAPSTASGHADKSGDAQDDGFESAYIKELQK